jgi:hypothetical protein
LRPKKPLAASNTGNSAVKNIHILNSEQSGFYIYFP